MGALFIAVAIVISVIYCGMKLHAWVMAQWFLVRIGRWLGGKAHHGKPITNAGWTRPGYGPALTPTGHAHRWWYRPGWQRASHRTGGTLGFAVVVYGLLAAFWLTAVLLSAAFLVSLGLASWRVLRVVQDRQHRRTFLHPLHLRAHAIAGHPRAMRAADWIKAELDSKGAVIRATLELPEGFPADDRDQKRLETIAASSLGIQNAVPSWRLAGPAPLLMLVHSPPPPGKFGMADLLPELEKCQSDEYLIGIGKGEEVIRASLSGDSPHVVISAGTGGTKSNMGSWLMLQNLLRDGVGQVLDPKRRLSYPWILKDKDHESDPLPNVAYAWTTAEMHDSMAWLPEELDRRADVAFSGMNARGDLRPGVKVGIRLFTIAEELNMAYKRLVRYWRENRSPDEDTASPAFTGLGETAFAGRATWMHLIMIGQFVSAEVTGKRDSSVKEQCGIILLTRYGPKGWRIMAGDIPMPPSPQETGRFQLVTGSNVREVQTPKFDGFLARELVLASSMAALPWDMPCKPRIPATVAAGNVLEGPSDLHEQSVSVAPQPPSAPGRGTFREALRAGVLHPDTTLSMLEMGRHRDPGFPPRAALRGKAYEYDFAALSAWDLARRS